MTASALPPSTLLAAASQSLEAGGYRRVEDSTAQFESGRLFEDAYGVALVVAYETYGQLIEEWPQAQDHLVEIMSRFWQRGEPKTWDGYLILLTSDEALDRYDEADRLRYDTTRVRKLVGSGEDLRTLADISRLLSPLLPLEVEPTRSEREDLLDALPVLLEASIQPDLLQAVLVAFRRELPLLDSIHDHLNGNLDR